MYDYLRLWRKFRGSERKISQWWQKGLHAKSTVIIALIVIPSAFVYYAWVSTPAEFPAGSIVTVEEGATLSDVGVQFEGQNIIKNRRALRVAVTILDGETGVIAGDYLLKDKENVIQIARRLVSGSFGLQPVKIRIPEGTAAREMAAIYAAHLPRFSEKSFIGMAEHFEGYLFPDTYFFQPNATERQVLITMISNFEEHVAEIEEEIRSFGRPLGDVIIMASLLEKEAHIFRDRRMISGVLWKRMEIGMPLQVDAAFLYFLGRTTFDLTLEDLQYDSPYNTYLHAGLPAGAITNPSLRAIEAAVTPIDNGNLFYLADFSGTTHYSATFEEHLRKKRIYLD